MTPLMEPPPEGDDAALFAELEGIFDEVSEYEVVDVTKFGDEELLSQFHSITREIKNRHEVLAPRTDEGRELHSLRAAMSVELRQRGLLG